MMGEPLRLLLIEDTESDALLLLRELKRGGFEPTFRRVETAEAFIAALQEESWDILISDYVLPHFSITEALSILEERGLDLSMIVVSGKVGEDLAVETMKLGAHDYVLKSNLTRLNPAIRRELHESSLRRERRQMAAQLLQSQKLDSIGRLAGGIAHDFNNLLTGIIGYTVLAEESLSDDDPIREYLETVRKAGERAAALTNQLLAFARKQIITPKVISLNDLVVEIDKLLRRIIGEDIEFITLLGAGLGRVKVDPGQFEQVLVNLAVNARDAMPKGGKLVIETHNVLLDADYALVYPNVAPGDYVMMSVSDTGIGMDETIQEHIFEPFFTTKEKDKGTGLGLATCHGIVNQNGGHIWLYSEPGKGTTFKIYLPLVQLEKETHTPQQAIVSPSGTETILIVEDEPMVRRLAVTALRKQGYNVLEAETGGAALHVAVAYPGKIDLLVTDVVMPQMSGKQVLESLQQVRPGIKALFVSGYTDNAVIHHSVIDVGVAFLQKPFTPGVLARKVREVLDAAE